MTDREASESLRQVLVQIRSLERRVDQLEQERKLIDTGYPQSERAGSLAALPYVDEADV